MKFVREMSFSIPGRLPGANELIGASRKGPYAGDAQKKKVQRICAKAIEAAGLLGQRIQGPAVVEIVWYERDRRRDVDNVQAGSKFVLDSCVQCGLLADDGRRFVNAVLHDVRVDASNPRVEVRLRSIN